MLLAVGQIVKEECLGGIDADLALPRTTPQHRRLTSYTQHDNLPASPTAESGRIREKDSASSGVS